MVCSHSTTTGGGKQKRQTKMEEVLPPISKESDIIINVDTVGPPSSRAVMVAEVMMVGEVQFLKDEVPYQLWSVSPQCPAHFPDTVIA